jgi:hypothetical protein
MKPEKGEQNKLPTIVKEKDDENLSHPIFDYNPLLSTQDIEELCIKFVNGTRTLVNKIKNTEYYRAAFTNQKMIVLPRLTREAIYNNEIAPIPEEDIINYLPEELISKDRRGYISESKAAKLGFDIKQLRINVATVTIAYEVPNIIKLDLSSSSRNNNTLDEKLVSHKETKPKPFTPPKEKLTQICEQTPYLTKEESLKRYETIQNNKVMEELEYLTLFGLPTIIRKGVELGRDVSNTAKDKYHLLKQKTAKIRGQ